MPIHVRRLAWVAVSTALVSLLAAGCGRIPTPGIYKLDIQQGNVVTEEMLTRLEPDMEKRKVRFILGTPLITDTFNEDRWDYLYSLKERGGRASQRHIVLIFDGDRLLRIEGDVEPSAITGSLEPVPETVVSVPDQEQKGLFSGVGGWFKTDDTRVPRKKPDPSETEKEEAVLTNLFEDGEALNSAQDQLDPDSEEQSAPAETSETDEYSNNVTPTSEETEEDGFLTTLKKKVRGCGR